MPASGSRAHTACRSSECLTRWGATVCVSAPATPKRPSGCPDEELAHESFPGFDRVVDGAELVGAERVLEDEAPDLVVVPGLGVGDRRERPRVVMPDEAGTPRMRLAERCSRRRPAVGDQAAANRPSGSGRWESGGCVLTAECVFRGAYVARVEEYRQRDAIRPACQPVATATGRVHRFRDREPTDPAIMEP